MMFKTAQEEISLSSISVRRPNFHLETRRTSCQSSSCLIPVIRQHTHSQLELSQFLSLNMV